MALRKFLPLVVLIFAVEYLKDSNRTSVAANTLYVFNSPEQFIQLQLRGLMWGKQPVFPAEEISLEFYSFAPEAKFKNPNTREIEMITDGKSVNFNRLAYQSHPSNRAQQLLPKSALITGKLSLEILILKFSAESIQSLVDANTLEFRIADAKFTLNDEQKEILREFGAYVLPPAGADLPLGNGIELIAPLLPAELSNASLASTLKWLSEHLKTGATTKADFAQISRFIPADLSGCKISYRIERQLTPGRGITATLHEIDLALMNPDSVRAISYDQNVILYLRSHRGSYGKSIILNSEKAAPAIVAAMKQAVVLCQS